MTIEQTIDERIDQFPVGMRVLAVDDNPTCLMLLETLLRRCQYHVTGSSQARTALKMLRENKERFDLVISDVDMPDMDGFKLLELVGLEMDLPVIMLSAYGDTKLVMKGITHGACDYLLKPVRIEELKNIWQHVIRRKRFDRREQQIHSKKVHPPPHPHPHPHPQFESAGENDQMKKQFINGRKRGYDLEDENEENGHENDDPSSQKKPRVVWSVELHRKFVAAVNHLGIDRAVPKRILELMNVEKLTRENVASHLQKYRLYLKRISCVASQQADMVAAFANSDSSYLQFGPLNLNPSIGYPNFQNNIYSIIQSGIQHGNILQGMPMNVDLQFNKPIASSSNSSFGVLKNQVSDDQRVGGDLSSMLTYGAQSEFTNDINLIGESNCEEQMENRVRCNDGSLEDLVSVMMMKQGNDKVMH